MLGPVKPAFSKSVRRRPWVDEGENAGRSRLCRRHVAAIPEHARRQRRPWTLVRRSEDGADEASSAAQHTSGLAERSRRVGHEHVSPPAEDAVDRVVADIKAFRVEHKTLDVRQPDARRVPLCRLDHRTREVADEDTARGPDERGRGEADDAGTGRELEKRLSAGRPEPLEHPLSNRLRRRLEVGVTRVPSRRHRLPDGIAHLSKARYAHRRRKR